MQFYKLGAIFSLIIASACTQTYQRTLTGPLIVSGHANLITDGYSRGCENVSLLPVTPAVEKLFQFSGDRLNDYFIDRVSFYRAIRGSEAWKSRQQIPCVGNGAFSFEKLPAAQYFLVAEVTWSMRWAQHGGYLLRKISISKDTNDVYLSIVNNHA